MCSDGWTWQRKKIAYCCDPVPPIVTELLCIHHVPPRRVWWPEGPLYWKRDRQRGQAVCAVVTHVEHCHRDRWGGAIAGILSPQFPQQEPLKHHWVMEATSVEKLETFSLDSILTALAWACATSSRRPHRRPHRDLNGNPSVRLQHSICVISAFLVSALCKSISLSYF